MKNSKSLNLKFFFSLFFIFSIISSKAQLDIPYVFLHKNLPHETITKNTTTIYSSPTYIDAKSIGRGKTNMMLGARNNKFWQNPAFLTYERFSIEVTNAQLILPQSTLDAITFIQEYDAYFQGKFVTDIREGLNKMINGSSPEEKAEGKAQYNNAINFLNKFKKEVAYSPDNPNIHGVSIYPKIQLQYKNFGFSVFKSVNMAFAISLGNIAEALSKTNIGEELDWNQITEIAQLLYHSFDSEGNISANGLPRLFAVTYEDLVANLGYGRQINENLRLGINVKFVNRAFSTDAIDSKDSYNALDHARDNLSNTHFFVTADFGGLYHFNQKKTTLGWTFKNIIPSKGVNSEAQFNYTESKIEIPKDENGKPYVGRVEDNNFIEDPSGDTLIYSYIVDRKVILPYELKNPFLFNLGLHHQLISNLELNFDMVDVLNQAKYYYNNYFDRLRIGAEYRLFNNIFAIRAGMAEFKPTFGAGLNIKVKNIIIDLDLAYAYNNLTNTPGYFFQIHLGYDKIYKK